ncbi:hypothetical protein [Aromatoleum buckelii]|uniref:Uncharacterized protein n=1 Tax=Aromatoleum buckelii TaxID=200254 RepID=A0ABX1N197_9RHOO|nr:hypothetical protein [Aromatoleum buckelii]MCK0510244.1 hypothetical protein [Aromatoleum buckelii]
MRIVTRYGKVSRMKMTTDNLSSDLPPLQRGRQVGDRPMTATERQRRSRSLKRKAGAREFLVRVEKTHLAVIEELAEAQGKGVAATLKEVLTMSLDRFAAVFARADEMRAQGATDDEIIMHFQRELGMELPAPRRREAEGDAD